MADRGFDVNDGVGLMMATAIKMPAFTKWKTQMRAIALEVYTDIQEKRNKKTFLQFFSSHENPIL